MKSFVTVLKFNPNHDKLGLFAAAPGDGGGGGPYKSILDIPREVKPREPDKWADFKELDEAVKRLSAKSYKGTPMTAENGFTFETGRPHRIVVKQHGKVLGESKWVWTKKGPQFRTGGWWDYQNYPTY